MKRRRRTQARPQHTQLTARTSARSIPRGAVAPDAAETVATIDLGSNSFHMIIARLHHGQLTVLDRMRETVRLAEGLNARKALRKDAMRRALACLKRFGERIKDMPPQHVRAVGTSTLRRATNARAFMISARKALGYPIEVIAGREEARLIYLGVAHDLSDDQGRRLVVDIGGGSSELIIGERFEPLLADSLHMGCVAYTVKYFADGRLRREAFDAARIAAGLELRGIKLRYRNMGWEHAVGTSGTINAVDAILRANGWSRDGITRAGIERIQKAMVAAGRVERLKLAGLEPDRAEVLAGGLSILWSIFDNLQLERMTSAVGALREGVLYDLVGRFRHEDVRDRTVQILTQRYAIDVEHAARVERTALMLLKQTVRDFELDELLARQLLGWAARLHEIGIAITYSGYHKHGAYILENGDMPGFSSDEQRVLAALIRTHRRKLGPELYQGLPPYYSAMTRSLSVLLRLAVLLNRSRNTRPLPKLVLGARKGRLDIAFPRGWLDEHPMTKAELRSEAERLAYIDFMLRVR